MARSFASASSHQITCGVGAGQALTGCTLAAIIRKTDDVAADRTIWHAGTAAGNRLTLQVQSSAASNRLQMAVSGSFIACTAFQVTAAQGWQLVGWTKASGTATPKAHQYLYGTDAWTHANGAATLGDMGGAPTTGHILGARTAGAPSNFWNGDIAAAGYWEGAMTDAEFEQLAHTWNAWLCAGGSALAPIALWLLDQAAVADNLPDWTGGGANQSSINGTGISAVSVPGFSMGHPAMFAGLL